MATPEPEKEVKLHLGSGIARIMSDEGWECAECGEPAPGLLPWYMNRCPSCRPPCKWCKETRIHRHEECEPPTRAEVIESQEWAAEWWGKGDDYAPRAYECAREEYEAWVAAGMPEENAC